VPPQRPAPADEPAQVDSVSAGHLTAARAAARVLAVVGPMDLLALAAVVARTRRFRVRNPLTDNDSLPR
jgi:hypothetical protein